MIGPAPTSSDATYQGIYLQGNGANTDVSHITISNNRLLNYNVNSGDYGIALYALTSGVATSAISVYGNDIVNFPKCWSISNGIAAALNLWNNTEGCTSASTIPSATPHITQSQFNTTLSKPLSGIGAYIPTAGTLGFNQSVVTDSNGTLQTSGASPANNVPQPNTRVWGYDVANHTTAFTGLGFSITNATGSTPTAANFTVSNQNLPVINYASAATTGDSAGFVEGQAALAISSNPTLQAWVNLPNSTDYGGGASGVRIWVGMGTAMTANAPGSDTPAGNYVAFRASTNASDTDWECVSATGSSSQTVVSSGVTISTATAYTLAISATTSSVTYYIDGASVCTITTNIPAAGAVFLPYVQSTTLSNNSRNLQVGYIYKEQNTPQ